MQKKFQLERNNFKGEYNMSFENGEILNIYDKEYICVSNIKYENDIYVYLMSNFKPLEIKIAKIIPNNNEIQLEIINNKEQKEILFSLFSEK